jgi:hypothetical protein
MTQNPYRPLVSSAATGMSQNRKRRSLWLGAGLGVAFYLAFQIVVWFVHDWPSGGSWLELARAVILGSVFFGASIGVLVQSLIRVVLGVYG